MPFPVKSPFAHFRAGACCPPPERRTRFMTVRGDQSLVDRRSVTRISTSSRSTGDRARLHIACLSQEGATFVPPVSHRPQGGPSDGAGPNHVTALTRR